jgi:hypothetical protein
MINANMPSSQFAKVRLEQLHPSSLALPESLVAALIAKRRGSRTRKGRRSECCISSTIVFKDRFNV